MIENVIMWQVMLIVLALMVFMLPLFPAYLEIRRSKEVSPLHIEAHALSVDAFAQQFKAGLQHELNDLQHRQTVQRDGHLSDGRSYLLLQDKGEPCVLPVPEPKQQHSLLIVLSRLFFHRDQNFAGEIYCISLSGSENAVYTSVYVEQCIDLGANSKVIKWMHAEKDIHLGPHCRLSGRVTAGQQLFLSVGTRFQRLSAPHIQLGNGAPITADAAQEAIPLNDWLAPDGMKSALHRWLATGDMVIPESVIVKGDLIAHGDLHIGDRSKIKGAIKCHGNLSIGNNVSIDGAIISRHAATIGRYCRITGPVSAATEITVQTGTIFGDMAHPVSLSAPVIRIGNGCAVYGTIWASVQGQVV